MKIVKKRYSCKHFDKRAISKKIKSIPDYSRVASKNDLRYTSIKNSVNTQIDTMIEKVWELKQ